MSKEMEGNPCIDAKCFFASCCHDFKVNRFYKADLEKFPNAVYDPYHTERKKPGANGFYYGEFYLLGDGEPFEGEVKEYCENSVEVREGVRVCGIQADKPEFCKTFQIGAPGCDHERAKDGLAPVREILTKPPTT